MKIALLQCNTVTGDVAGNAERILAAVREAAAQGADLCVTPELALCGVAPGSYLRAEDFAEGCKAGLQMLADALQDGPPLLVGAPVASVYASGLLSNAAILVQKGRWSVVSRKVYQTYGQDSEARFFDRASPAASWPWTAGALVWFCARNRPPRTAPSGRPSMPAATTRSWSWCSAAWTPSSTWRRCRSARGCSA